MLDSSALILSFTRFTLVLFVSFFINGFAFQSTSSWTRSFQSTRTRLCARSCGPRSPSRLSKGSTRPGTTGGNPGIDWRRKASNWTGLDTAASRNSPAGYVGNGIVGSRRWGDTSRSNVEAKNPLFNVLIVRTKLNKKAIWECISGNIISSSICRRRMRTSRGWGCSISPTNSARITRLFSLFIPGKDTEIHPSFRCFTSFCSSERRRACWFTP